MKRYEKQSRVRDSLRRIPRIRYRLIAEGLVVGAAAGGVVSCFRLALIYAESLRGTVIRMAQSSQTGTALALLILGGLCFGTWLCLRIEPMIGGSGIPQVKGELVGRMFQNWWRVILCKLAGGTMAIGAGLSLGREGPSIQLGAMVGKGFGLLTDRLATEEKLLMTCGAAAGLSCAFSAPLAGVVFTLEELHRNFSTDILLGTMVSAIAADFVSSNIFGLRPVFTLHMEAALPLRLYLLILIMGALIGVFGVAYNALTAWCQDMYGKIHHRSIRLAIPFCLVIPLVIWYPLPLGSGYQLVNQTAAGEYALSALILLLVMKFSFSIISFGSGAPGGIFLPLLVIGGVSGGVFCLASAQFLPGVEEYLPNFVIMGMVAYFSAIVRSPVTGVILITEMAGDFSNFLTLCLAAFTAYVAADLLGGRPIYDQLLDRQLASSSDYGMTRPLKKHKVLMESDVYVGSRMDGQKIEKMLLPKGCLVISVLRMNEEVVPNGSTVLRGGDKLTILCNEGDMKKVEEKLDAICRTVSIR